LIRIAALTVALLAATPLVATAQEAAPLADEIAADDSAPLTPEESAQLAAALQFDPAVSSAAAKPLKATGAARTATFDLTRATQPNGTDTYSFKRALPALNARVGADLGTGTPSPYYAPDRPMAPARGNSGAAWASVDVTSAASIDARVDPQADQGRLAATLRHAIPFGSNYSLTVQNSSGVTDSIGSPGATTSTGMPMTTLPQATDTGATQTWDNQPSLQFDVKSTGTSFSAGLARSSADPVVHNRIAAEQQVYGPLHVSTAVADVGAPTQSKSISANFKLTW
jgi:hypothetical protein